jgi:death-on-curing protein
LRDPSLFEGAVIHPRNVYYYAQGDLFDVAAAYALHSRGAGISGWQQTRGRCRGPGLPGRERRHCPPPGTDRFHEAMIAVAGRRLDKADLAELFRQGASGG